MGSLIYLNFKTVTYRLFLLLPSVIFVVPEGTKKINQSHKRETSVRDTTNPFTILKLRNPQKDVSFQQEVRRSQDFLALKR